MYTQNELVRVAKRENNNKRKYLVLNPRQGKHVPVKPSKALDMFDALGEVVKNQYQKERLLLIGFAETATAIGAAIAVRNGGYYMQTTREIIEGVRYLFFSEAHSHATEQKLVREDLESVLPEIDRILFIEDEVTTGNTILNIIRLIQEEFPGSIAFGVASLLNGMNQEARKAYEDLGIPIHYLVKTNHDSYENLAEQVRNDGEYRVMVSENDREYRVMASENNGEYRAMVFLHDSAAVLDYKEIICGNYQNARRLVTGCGYKAACEALWRQTEKAADLSKYGSILVLGTEEFMYPGLYLGKQIEKLGKEVRFHATTRSPIVVSREKGYPLHTRYQLASVYDKTRPTFVYDVMSYDLAIIVTDAKTDTQEDEIGLCSIVNALKAGGTEQILVIRWYGR